MLALAISALLHAALLGSRDLARWLSPAAPPVVAPAIYARLLPPPDADQMLKNTLSDSAPPRTARLPPPPGDSSQAVPAVRIRTTAQHKLAEHVFYPPEAVARGLEGEVRLLLILGPAGEVLEARIASSSGHPLLDRAATDAAFAMQRLSVEGVRELILPVIFKLQ